MSYPAIGGNTSIARDVTKRIVPERRVDRLNRCFINLGPDTRENLEMIIDTARELFEGKEARYCKPAKNKIMTISTAAGREDETKENYADFDMSIYRAYIGCPVKAGGRNIGCLAVLDDRVRRFTKDDREILGTLAQAISKDEERLINEAAMSDFLNVASHELRHPITVIQGFAVTLKEQWQRLDDERKKEFLVTNLISNASLYSAPGSRIEIEVEEASDHILVSVLDRGKGIPEDDREVVFERFYQGEDADHHSSPGMGLGLNIAKEVVEAHRGKIWYEPRDGGGSVFRFILPAS